MSDNGVPESLLVNYKFAGSKFEAAACARKDSSETGKIEDEIEMPKNAGMFTMPF